MRENTAQKNSEYRHFSRSDSCKSTEVFDKTIIIPLVNLIDLSLGSGIFPIPLKVTNVTPMTSWKSINCCMNTNMAIAINIPLIMH